MDNIKIIKILFQYAKDNKWTELIEFLKKNEDVDINIRDDSNNYLINYAILQNQKEALLILIQRGANIDIIDQDGRSLLFIPIKYGYNDIIRLLLDYNKTNVGISLIDIKDKNENIPLHYAINFKNKEAILILLEAGSDVNSVDQYGNNALHLAVYSKDIEICKMILKRNIDINMRTKTGETALHIACNFQLEDIVILLIENKIDINIQDFDYVFTALHYSVNINNKNITKQLLANNADINMQDYLGNTALHYAIIEENKEIISEILYSEYTKEKINVNIYNIYNKLPIHILLEKSNNFIQSNLDFLRTLINKSNLNFQDNNGNTPLHILSKTNLWKQFTKELETKKLNIFIRNNKKQRPIELIDKGNIEEYINLTINSYIFILRNRNFTWKYDWENLCNHELFKNKLTDDELKIITKYININKTSEKEDICRDIIKNKLMDIYKLNDEKCDYTSYPIKLNKKCIIIEEVENIEFCTFTGATLDIMIGLIYLLLKHKNACSTITTNFFDNKELCNYYKSISGISKCEIFNLEIMWVQFRLFFSSGFVEKFNLCKQNENKRFIIIPLGIELKEESHANYLIFDKINNEIERFEPYGSHAPYQYDYNPTLLDNVLEMKFHSIDKSIIYIRPEQYMPKIGFQSFDVIETRRMKIGDPEGFCALWSIWWTDYRMIYSDVDRKSLIKQMLKYIKLKNMSYKNLIRNYSKNITDIRDNIFKKAKMTINDWLNEQYNEDQLIIIINEITKLIISLS